MDALRTYFYPTLGKIFRNEKGNSAVKIYWVQHERALCFFFKNARESGTELNTVKTFYLEKYNIICRHLKPYNCANFEYFRAFFANLFSKPGTQIFVFFFCKFSLLLTTGGNKPHKVFFFQFCQVVNRLWCHTPCTMFTNRKKRIITQRETVGPFYVNAKASWKTKWCELYSCVFFRIWSVM